MKTASKKIKR